MIYLRASITLLMVFFPYLAQAADKKNNPGMPQLDYATFIPQIFWLFVTFIILYLIMSRAILPKIADILEQRQDRMASDLQEAEKLREEAQNVLLSYESEIDKAKLSAQKITDDGKQKIAQDISTLDDEFEMHLKRQTQEAENSINETKEKAKSEIKAASSELVKKLTKALINIDPKSEEVNSELDRQLQQ